MNLMFKIQRKINLNLKFIRFLIVSPILLSLPNTYLIGEARAGLEFQWEQNTGYNRLKWFQKESKKNFKNTIYFFLRPIDRKNSLLKVELAIPETFKTKIKTKNISFCKVSIGGFEGRTKCLEKIPADIEINNDDLPLRRINIYPFSPVPSNKDSYAIVLKASNPKRTGLFQFHSFGQPAGKPSSSYLGSWTILID